MIQVAILLLTEITPKSLAVHNATEVARFVVSLDSALWNWTTVHNWNADQMLKNIGFQVHIFSSCTVFM